jgi:hypothetical protein
MNIKILALIEKIWKEQPDLRFFQLLFNYTRLSQGHADGKVRDPFYYYDDEIIKDLENWIDENKKKKT